MKKKLKTIEENTLNFETDNFSGPLDLLIHLSKTNEIEISTISLDLLIDQYLNYIEQVKDQGVTVQSSYLEMAAELIRLKSQMLLPHISDSPEMEEQFENLKLDRNTLIEKLLEYKKYKHITTEIANLSTKRAHLYYRQPENLDKFRDTSKLEHFKVDDFFTAITSILEQELQNKNGQRVLNITEVDIDIYIEQIKQIKQTIAIQSHINKFKRRDKIGFFMGLLEALKHQYIEVFYQEETIYLKPKEHYETTI